MNIKYGVDFISQRHFYILRISMRQYENTSIKLIINNGLFLMFLNL